MQFTENQKALANQIGLTATTFTENKNEATLVNSKNSTPTTNDIIDTYYPKLIELVVSQQVTDSLRGANLLNSAISYESWVNGSKQKFYTGILELSDYDKPIVIGDFNSKDPSMYDYKNIIDWSKFSSLKLDRIGIVAAFKNIFTLETFTENLIKRLKDTIEIFIQNEQARLLALDTGAVFTMVYDTVVDIKDVEPKDVLQDFQTRIGALSTASGKHLALTDETVKYSLGSESNGRIIWNNSYSAVVNANVQAILYNPDKIYPKMISEKIDFASIDTASQDLSYVKLIFLDKDAITRGYKVRNFSWDFKAPKGQVVVELHNQFGLAVAPEYVKIGYYDSSEYPEGPVAFENMIKGMNKEADVKKNKPGIKINYVKLSEVLKSKSKEQAKLDIKKLQSQQEEINRLQEEINKKLAE